MRDSVKDELQKTNKAREKIRNKVNKYKKLHVNIENSLETAVEGTRNLEIVNNQIAKECSHIMAQIE